MESRKEGEVLIRNKPDTAAMRWLAPIEDAESRPSRQWRVRDGIAEKKAGRCAG
jgi:hypothetical protein